MELTAGEAPPRRGFWLLLHLAGAEVPGGQTMALQRHKNVRVAQAKVSAHTAGFMHALFVKQLSNQSRESALLLGAQRRLRPRRWQCVQTETGLRVERWQARWRKLLQQQLVRAKLQCSTTVGDGGRWRAEHALPLQGSGQQVALQPAKPQLLL